MGCLASLRQVPKGSDSPRAVRSMFGLGASEASAAERPVKQNGRQRSGDRRQGRVSERGQREMETELFFFIFGSYFSHFFFFFLFSFLI